MRGWDVVRVARAAGARLERGSPQAGSEPGPRRAGIDSRAIAPGELFVGLRGERTDGGAYAAEALQAGAWGVLVAPEHARSAAEAVTGAVVLAHPDPLNGLHALARAWRRELRAGGTKVVAITGSTGKTSTKDILAALLARQRRVVASPENLNTEIGLPLAVLAAPSDTEVLILEMAMRGVGQIAELTAIAEPDVGVIVNVGPAHLELLGSLEAIASSKAELIARMAPGGTVVIPTDEPLLAPHLRADVRTITFGDRGDVVLEGTGPAGEVVVREGHRRFVLQPSFGQAHNLRNLLAAVASAVALGVTPSGRVQVRFSALRGERLTLPGAVVLINDCYNANPMSMRAAIDELTETATARPVAVLGDMLELGADAPRLHREIGAYAAERGVQLLVTVGPLAAGMGEAFAGETHAAPDAATTVGLLRGLLCEGDTVLVKGSRDIGLERVAKGLGAVREQRDRPVTATQATVPAGGRRRR
jgi:UDP-N-acetylmuramoyl-tripeptide--D-alanyl-D-alanine ligase